MYTHQSQSGVVSGSPIGYCTCDSGVQGIDMRQFFGPVKLKHWVPLGKNENLTCILGVPKDVNMNSWMMVDLRVCRELLEELGVSCPLGGR